MSLPEKPLSFGEWLLLAVAAYFVSLKVLYSFWAFPIADEAYYWLWGQHLALSYFDHPPLQGWVQGLVHAVLGRSLFALRLPALLAFAGIVWVLLATARRIGGERWRLVFLKSLAVYLASPVFGGFFGSVVFNDYLLVALMMGSGWFFFCYFADVEAAGRGRLRDLFLAAVLLGLAGLTKYNGAYLGLAVVATVLIRPGLRPLLGSWPIYAAGALTVAMQTPVLIWNWQQGFASFQFHMGGRFASSFQGFNIAAMKAFAIDTASLLGPFMIPAIVSFFLRRQADPFERVGKTIAIWTFWLSTATFLYIANYNWVVWWWNIAAFALLFPFMGRYIDRFTLTFHVLWGGAVSTVMVLSFAIMPVTMLVGGSAIMETQTEFGWEEIGTAVRDEQRAHNAVFLAANRYQAASKLAFVLNDRNVTAISSRRDAFDDWWDAAAHLGETAIVLVDGEEDIATWRAAFESVTLLRTIDVERFGYKLASYEIYLGTNYRPPPP